MEITYVVIITIITYICGAITKCFVDKVPSKYIPIQNVIIGIIAGLICYFTKIEPNLLQALVLCLVASMGAGGIADLSKLKEGE
ncbi:MAG TPA: hypothetical protein IAB27_05155 [Candidatus Coprosoma intestinipullorum]|uniref:Holin n=1 Tax=Candidatus Coprosoma intestinipullorum TaxID=2840752 RepID=A0A9D1D025_9FIRM|nr:hypothetical protein [Candidatus Coprosoma intestinipullorum]